MKDLGITEKQIIAIKMAIDLGRTLQSDHPEISDLYKYYYQSEILDILDIQSTYGVTKEIGRNGIYYALVGYDGRLSKTQYEGLLSEEDRLKIGKEHIEMGKRKGGKKLFEQKKGMFARTKQELREDCKRGGKVVGKKIHEEKIGVHARNSDQMRLDGIKGVLAKGDTPWTSEEKDYAYELSNMDGYQRGNHSNNVKIAREINKRFHNGVEIRTSRAVQIRLSRYRKSLEEKVEE